MDKTIVIHNSHLIFGKREIRLAWYEMYRNSHFVLWNWLTFCIQRTNSVNKSCLHYYICTYLLKALWLRFCSSLQCILLKSDWRNHVETGWANIFYGKWNYIAFHEHYNLVSIRSIFFAIFNIIVLMHLILNINKLFRYNMNDTKGKNYVYQKLCLYI